MTPLLRPVQRLRANLGSAKLIAKPGGAPVPDVSQAAGILRFGVFELDLRAGELRKRGLKVKLQEKPLQILALLLEHPGEVVTREELRRRLWAADTFVDFDHSVNTAVNKLREALGDSAKNPRFIETLPRHGYRFIATLLGPSRESVAQPKVRPEKVRLAVLPLDNLSADPGEEHFVDGMTEELITELGGLQPARLGVIARTSTMKYKQTKKGIDEIGRELGVDYVVEGSVRRADGRVRISAQLIQVSDQTHLWAQSYERELSGILAVQSEVARAIATRIQIELAPAPRGRLASSLPTTPQAYELYLKGRYYLNRANPHDHEKALAYFQQAVEEDPLYAAAYAGIADTYVFLAFYLGLPRESALKARNAATKALELDPDLAGAHTSLAAIKAFNDWDWAGAEAEFTRAIELDPGASEPHRIYGEFLALFGRHEQAIAEARQARELDPLSSNANYDLAFALYMARRYDEAVAQLQKVLELDPKFLPAHAGLGHVYAAQSRYAEALAELAKAGVRPELTACVHALAGREGKARKGLAEALASKGAGTSTVTFSVTYFLLGEKDKAFECLEQGYQKRDWLMICLRTFPPFDPLRSDPRFQNLLRRMKFPP
jgi:TolB-like protein/Tfp pilus assembly protein PilF